MNIENLTFIANKYSNKDLFKAFDKFGAVIIKGAIDRNKIDALEKAILILITSRLKSLSVATPAPQVIDECFILLESQGACYVAELFVAIRQLPELYQLVFDEELLDIVKQILPNTLLQVPIESCGIRADSFIDDKRDFHWHQDYPYITLSEPSITGWVPLRRLEEDMGYLIGVLNSHKKIEPVIYDQKQASIPFQGHKIYQLSSDKCNELEKSAIEFTNINLGDILLIDTKLLHRSGKNNSNKVRWTVLPRYGDALNKNIIDRGWKTIRDDDGSRLFNHIHAELIQK